MVSRATIAKSEFNPLLLSERGRPHEESRRWRPSRDADSSSDIDEEDSADTPLEKIDKYAVSAVMQFFFVVFFVSDKVSLRYALSACCGISPLTNTARISWHAITLST